MRSESPRPREAIPTNEPRSVAITPHDFRRLREIFESALERSPPERAAFVANACGGNTVLVGEVERMLAADANYNPLLDASEQPKADRFRSGAVFVGFHIISVLGRGGMGEVYRARDVKLNRDVALKILPQVVAFDPDRLARFRREAQVLASLNHANIAAIYGFEESNDVQALVLELVEGPTLADRIAHGPIAVDEALSIARQIAEALEAAHEQGIVHRDLKPANIKLRPDGTVKVLDFGLAKALDSGGTAANASQSPAITTPPMTEAGMILGTAQYMAPEQAAGGAADKRSDLWAFGVVLMEMLTGRPVFTGETLSHVLACVSKSEPDWTTLPPNTPPLIRRLLGRCLEKNRKRRLDSAVAARLEIEEALAMPASSGAAPFTTGALGTMTRRMRVPLGVLGALAILVAGAGVMGVVGPLRRSAGDAPPAVARFVINVAPADQLLGAEPQERSRLPRRPSRTAIALSPNGQQLVFSAGRGDTQQLYLRALDRLDATPIAGTDNSDSPFFSPDSQWVGFLSGGELRKVPASGGPVVTISKTAAIEGASWGSDDTIVFARIREGLWQVSADGGTPRQLTTVDVKKGEVSHRLPHILPDGKAVIFTIQKATFRWDDAQIVVRSLVTGVQTVLVEGGADARYVPTGHLVYARLGSLMAAPFDLASMKVTGGAVGVVEGVMQAVNTSNGTLDNGVAQFSLSGSGALIYVPGGIFPDTKRSVVWVDRAGAIQPLPLPASPYASPRLSPDGQRLALYTQGMERVVWLYDLVRGTLTRLTTEGQNAFPVWAPDGQRVAFQSATAGPVNLFWKPADGSGAAERLTSSEYIQWPGSWSPDGRTLAFVQNEPPNNTDIWTLSLTDHERTPRPFVRTAANERWPDFSPDGHWLAFSSGESGREEVYVQPYPGPGQRHQISAHGGVQPAWSRNGRELFYAVPNPNTSNLKMMVVDVGTTPRFTAGVPKPLQSVVSFSTPIRGYDVAPDGRGFITVREIERPPEPAPAQMILVQNWAEELKRRVPSRK